jgi:hypothetical protein
MHGDILGAADSGKITGAVSAANANIFMYLVTKQGFENSVHVVIGDQAKAAAVGPEQQVNLRRKLDADPHPHERFKNRQLHGTKQRPAPAD